MEIKKLKHKVLGTKKGIKPHLMTANNSDGTRLSSYSENIDKTLSSNSINLADKKYSRSSINKIKNIETTDDVISIIQEKKEEKLLNLIVNTIVKSTLEQLYGKESN